MSTSQQPGRVDARARPANESTADRRDSRPNPQQPGRVQQPAQPLPDAEPGSELEAPSAPGHTVRGHWRAVFWLLVSLVGGLLAYRLWTDITLALQSQPWAGFALAGLVVALLLALILALARELAAFRRLQTAWQTQQIAATALAAEDAGALRNALRPYLKMLRRREPDRVAEFEAGAADQSEAAEVQRLFETVVLAPLDAEAKRQIRRSALTVGAAVAAAPHPALDAIIVIWRAFVMVRRVAEVYGLRPTPLAALKLVKQTLINAFLAAGIDAAGNALLTQIGGGILEIVGRRFAEGMISSQRLLRLGVAATQMCRPLVRPAGRQDPLADT